MSWNLSSRNFGFFFLCICEAALKINVFWSIVNEPGRVDTLTPPPPNIFVPTLSWNKTISFLYWWICKCIFNCMFLYLTKIRWSFVKAIFPDILILQGKGTIWCSLILSQSIWGILLLKGKKWPICSRDWDMKSSTFRVTDLKVGQIWTRWSMDGSL